MISVYTGLEGLVTLLGDVLERLQGQPNMRTV